jgi:hypothetical protein
MFSFELTEGGRNPAPPKGWLKPYKSWDKPPINWCRISTIHSILRNIFSIRYGWLKTISMKLVEST